MSKFEYVLQDGLKDCGVCSLLTIIKTYGGDVSLEYLRVLTNTNKDGTNFKYLMDASKSLGFECKALTGDIKYLNEFPCIAHVIINKSYKHFIVIHKKSKDKLIIADPTKGIVKMSINQFNNISTNNYLIISPNKPIPCINDNKKFINYIKKILYEYKTIFFTIFVFSLLYTCLNIFTSYNFQFIIEDSINVSSKNNLYFITIFILFLTIIKYISDYYRNILFNYINHILDLKLFKKIYSHIISLPYIYYKNRTTGEIISRLNDLNDVKETLSTMFIYTLVDSVLVIFVFISLCTINRSLAFISLFILFLYLVLIKIFKKPINKNIMDINIESANINSFLVETIEANSSIKNLMIEDNIIDKFDNKYSKFVNKSYKFNKLINTQNLLKNLIDGIGLIILIFISSLYTLNNDMTIGQMITFNSLIIYFLEPIKNIIDSSIFLEKMKISFKRIEELYSIDKEELIIDKKCTNDLFISNIDIFNLSFSYNGRKDLLNNIDLHINPGEKILIYGKSGTGKSTLAKIFMKYLQVPRDKVFISNKDINDFNLKQLRDNICYVSQDEVLFTDSIYENIVLSRDIKYDDFLEISKLCFVDKIIKNSILSYDMLLEENASNISGGERQRIILARTLLKKSNIFIFDESLNQMDIELERIILNNIFKKFKDKTFIIISHRFYNNDLFDKTYNFEELNDRVN